MSNPQVAGAFLLAVFVGVCTFIAWGLAGGVARYERVNDLLAGSVFVVAFVAIPCFLLALIFGLVP